MIHCGLFLCLKLSLRPGGWFHGFLLQVVQTIIVSKSVQAVSLQPPLIPNPTVPLLDMDIPDTSSDIKANSPSKLVFPFKFITVQNLQPLLTLITIFMVFLFFMLLCYLVYRFFIQPCRHKLSLL